jgi:hypothetical protein
LRSAFRDRDSLAETEDDAEHQHACDATTSMLLDLLKSHGEASWRALWDLDGGAAIWLAGLTHCLDWRPTELATLARTMGDELAPNTPPAQALAFGLPAWNGSPLLLSSLLEVEPDAPVLLALSHQAPVLDVESDRLESLPDPLAAWIAWLWARDGFGAKERALLLSWHGRDEEATSFWASLSLVLRCPEFRDAHTDLQTWAGTDPMRRTVAGALSEGLRQGPFEENEARRAVRTLFHGSRPRRLARAFRLVAFLAPDGPLLDPFAPAPRQCQVAKGLIGIMDRPPFSAAFD